MIDAKQVTALYLMSKGATKTCATTAADAVDGVCHSNRHFTTNHRNRRCTLDGGWVKRFAVTVDIVFPDSETRGTRRLVYTVKVAKSGKVTWNMAVKAA